MSRHSLVSSPCLSVFALVAALAWLFLSLSALSAHAQRGAVTVPRALDQLTAEAETIVHGSVVSAKIEPHPKLRNLHTIVVSLKVQDTYKGAAGKSFVFRQYVWESPAFEASQYRKGQELLLFLGPVSDYGLSSPVGLEQGRFQILRTAKSAPTALNGRGNAGLFNAVLARAKAHNLTLSSRTAEIAHRNQPGPLRLSDLEDAIRTFAGKH